MISYDIKKILAPVDLSDSSLNALNTAACLAQNFRAELQVLNVIEPSYSLNGNDKGSENEINSEVIKALLANIERSTGIKPGFIQQESIPFDAIMKESISGNYDLIVIGTHGVSGVREGFLGSTAYNIIKYASCPILTVPNRQRSTIFNRVLFPIRPVRGALKRIDIVSKFIPDNATIDVLALNYKEPEPTTGILEKIVNEISTELSITNIEIRTGWATGGSIAENILEQALRNDSQLIILTSEVDAMSKYNYIGPHAQKMLNNSRFPVLSVKRPGIPILV